MNLVLAIVLIIIALIAGLLIGFYVSRSKFQKYLKENPPITEKMIRAMYSQMGRTPSEKQIRQIMKQTYNAEK